MYPCFFTSKCINAVEWGYPTFIKNLNILIYKGTTQMWEQHEALVMVAITAYLRLPDQDMDVEVCHFLVL